MSTNSSDSMPSAPPTAGAETPLPASSASKIRAAMAAGDLHLAHRQCLQRLNETPQDAELWNLFAETLYRMERPAAAADALRQSLVISPRQPETLTNLATLLTESGDGVTALELLKSAVRLFPNFAPVYQSVGQAHHQLGQYEAAAIAYRKALVLDAESHASLVNLGAVMLELEKIDESERLLRDALRRDPIHAPTLINLAATLNRQHKFAEAETHAREAVQLAGHGAEACNNLGTALLGQGQVRDGLKHLRDAAERAPHLAHSYLFALGHDDQLTDEEINAAHCRWGRQAEAAVAPLASKPRRGPGLVRIGYVSGDFRVHAVTRYLLPLLEHHDRGRFQVIGYSESLVEDQATLALQRLCDDWRITAGATDEAVAGQIVQDGIDILVDLAGHTRGNRLGVFALRPAPVQVTWLGYPHTTGLTRIDYLLTNRILNPSESAGYAEQLYWLEGPTACWLPPQDASEVASSPAARPTADGWLTFGALHRPSKVSEATLRLWTDVLRAVPQSRLRVLHPLWTGKRRVELMENFEKNGLGDRVECRLRTPSGNYLDEYNEVDVALDATPWTGGTTIRDACWMGVLPIAWCGSRRSARGSADVLHWLGLQEWIAHTHEEYVQLAVRAAEESATRERLRATLRTTVAERLCDSAAITRSVERGFLEMLERKAA